MIFEPRAKEVYNLYQVELGAVDAPPFEHLPVREQQAWETVSGFTEWQRERIEDLEAELRQTENRVDEVRCLKAAMEDERDELRKELAAAKIALRALRSAQVKV